MMGKDSWYRKKTWSPEDEKDFYTHLQRARTTYNKAQYLRIQAYYLQTECSPPDYQAALALLEYLFTHFPDPNELGSAYLQKANCCEALGKIDEALSAYRNSIKLSKNNKGVYTTDAPVHFALFAAKKHLAEYYDEALNSFKGAEMALLMPSSQFNALAAIAIMADDTGEKRKAQNMARKALAILEQTDIGFESFDQDVRARLLQITELKKDKWWRF